MIRSLLFLIVLLQLCSAWAQTPQPGQRERELLRRAQAALRDVTAERDALRAEKQALVAREAQASKEGAATAASAASLRIQLARAREEAEALRTQLETARRESADRLAALERGAAERETALRQQLAGALRERDERTASNQRVTALLADSTAALAEAQRRNAELHAFSRELIERWRNKTAAEALAQAEPLFGVAAVRAEDQAEAWRRQADALKTAR
jgi:hypothetical protein